MFGFGPDDDDGDFMPASGGNKLASLFGVENPSPDNKSFTYTAPKQPKKQTAKKEEPAAAPSSSSPAVLHAVATHAFKYVDGKYAPQGKLGTAILGSHASSDYKILLYLSKTQQVTNAKITPSFSYTVQPQNYANFYDDARQSWSIMFDTEQQAWQFAKQVTLAKANSAGSGLDSIIQQDILPGEGGVLEPGDAVEVKYTGWLLTDHKFGEVFDSNMNADKLFRFKLGKGKVIKGWDDGVLGMKKGGRRVLIIPPQLAYGTQGMGTKVPANSTLIFDIEAVRVKLNKEKDSPQTSSAPSPAPSSEPDVPDDVKSRSRSISEQSAQSPKSDKAKLISRMAKMGKPMLPLSGAIAAQPDSDEDEEVQNATQNEAPPNVKPELPSKPIVQPAPQAAVPQQMPQAIPQSFIPPVAQPIPEQPIMSAPQPVQGMPAASQVALFQNPMQYQQMGMPYGYPQQPGAPQPFPPVYPQQPYQSQPVATQPAPDPNLPVLMSETRQQNTEVRIAISKMQDKVDKVLEKLDTMNAKNQVVQQMPMPGMESGLLVHNIERIVQENDKLKKDIYEKSAQMEAQNEKISELIQRNQRYMEQSNAMLEHQNDSYTTTATQAQAKVRQLEQEKVQLATDLSLANSQLATVQLEIGALKKHEGEIKQQLEGFINSGSQQKDDILKFKTMAAEYSNKVDELTQSLKDEKQARKSLETKLSSLEDEHKDLQSANAQFEKTLTERKKKAATEKQDLERDLEELKAQYEEELQGLRERLRKQKSSTGVATAEQVAQVERELKEEWQDKCERLVAANQEKNSRILRDMQEEKQLLQDKVNTLEERLSNVKSARGENEKQVAELMEKVEELSMWRDRYDTLRSQASFMKERYEERLSELESEKDEAVEEAERAKLRPEGNKIGKEALATEVKKIMNSVFYQLRGEFETEKSYSGSKIHAGILKTIKEITLKMTKPEKDDEEEEESESEEEDDSNIPAAAQAVSRTEPKPPAPASQTVGIEKQEVIQPQVVSQSEARNSSEKDNKTEAEVEVLVQASVSNVTGDRGNLRYIEELKQSAPPVSIVEDVMVANVSQVTGDKGNPMYANELNTAAKVEDIVGDIIVPKTTSISGGKHYPYDTQEMNEKTEVTVVDDLVVSRVSHITGDRGNAGYAKELDRRTADEIEQVVVANVSNVTGGRGNPLYREELTKSAEEAVFEEVVSASTANVVGDRGNPAYAATLNALEKEAVIEDVVSASAANVTGDRGNPAYTATLNALEKEAVIEDVVSASTANVTGDRGNPAYAATLNALEKEAVIEDVVSASTANVTGDRGNPAYAATLNVLEKDDVTRTTISNTDKTATESFVQDSKETNDATRAMVENMIMNSAGDNDNNTNTAIESASKQETEDKPTTTASVIKSTANQEKGDMIESADSHSSNSVQIVPDVVDGTEKSNDTQQLQGKSENNKAPEHSKENSVGEKEKTGSGEAAKMATDSTPPSTDTTKNTATPDTVNNDAKATSDSVKKDSVIPADRVEKESVVPSNNSLPLLLDDGNDDPLFAGVADKNAKRKDEANKKSSEIKAASLFDDGDDFDFTIKDSKDTKPINKKSPPKKDDKKKVDSDDDLRQRPPPLFGDDDEEDDMDWFK